jgi:ribosomal-protein-alanine N-acetyltransferase
MVYSNYGNGLILRPTVPSDAPVLLHAYQDESFMRLYRSNYSQQTELELANLIAERAEYSPAQLGYVEWMIVHRQHGSIGVAALGDYSPVHQRAEFLIGLFEPQRRSLGYGTEATLLVLDIAFNNYQLNKIYSYVYDYNESSHRSMIKFGFRAEGLLAKHHYLVQEQRFVDLYVNGITAEAFRQCETIRRYSWRLLERDITQLPQTISLSTDQQLSIVIGEQFLKGLRDHLNI